MHERARIAKLDRVFDTLSENFALAKKPLSFMSERYIQFNKYKWFATKI